MEVSVIVLPLYRFVLFNRGNARWVCGVSAGWECVYVASLPRDGHRLWFLRDEMMTHFTVTLRFYTFSIQKMEIVSNLFQTPIPVTRKVQHELRYSVIIS